MLFSFPFPQYVVLYVLTVLCIIYGWERTLVDLSFTHLVFVPFIYQEKFFFLFKGLHCSMFSCFVSQLHISLQWYFFHGGLLTCHERDKFISKRLGPLFFRYHVKNTEYAYWISNKTNKLELFLSERVWSVYNPHSYWGNHICLFGCFRDKCKEQWLFHCITEAF